MSPLLWRSSPVTEALLQSISGQVQGDEVEVQCDNDGGLSQACLRLSKVVRSLVENCSEVMVEVRRRRMRKMERRCGGGGDGGFILFFRWWFSLLGGCVTGKTSFCWDF
ncbi:hypothetical protein HanPSC8_Chr03g0116991 [Helianthus annuus]|nr:hypothetical protein HanPSC8_Chr03g0116991 [Helianthus annuus]